MALYELVGITMAYVVEHNAEKENKKGQMVICFNVDNT